jgi:transcriptional regulator with XRE-family HTH domain
MDNSMEKQEKTFSPGVAIDGPKVRAIREAKKLTQLYVASVVGVTTDTISRWENNRYPTMRRDNAEKLAVALEVELPEILAALVSPAQIQEIPAPQGKGKNNTALFLFALVLVAAAGLLIFSRLSPNPVAVRKLPRYGAPGEIIPVQIKVSRSNANIGGFIIREHFPPGWQLVASLPPPAVREVTAEEVKWLIPGGSSPVTVSYTVQASPSSTLNSAAAFSGSMVARADGLSRTESIDGDRLVRVAGVHWADTNGDGRIDDNEIMPAYYLTEEMKGLGLDWKTIEAIWSARGYVWDKEKKDFVVVK